MTTTPWRQMTFVRAALGGPIRRGIWLGLGCALAAGLMAASSIGQGLEDWALDWCFQQRGTRPTQANIVLVDLDAESLDRLQKPLCYCSPELAKLVRFAKSKGAAAIGIDMIVPESLNLLPDLQRDRPGDAATLSDAVLEAGNVIFGQWLQGDTSLEPLIQWRVQYEQDQRELPFVTVSEDADNFLRRQDLVRFKVEAPIWHFAQALYIKATNKEPRWDGSSKRLTIDDRTIPLEPGRTLRVNFVGPPGHGQFKRTKLSEVLRAAAGQSKFDIDLAGAIVIVGAVGKDSQDVHATPFANGRFRFSSGPDGPSLMAGPEFHANIVATLVDQAYVLPLGWMAAPLLVLTGIFLGVCFTRCSLEFGAVAAIVHHFAWKLVCLGAFVYLGWRVPMISVLLVGALTYATAFALRWRLLRSMLGVVQSEAVARLLESGLDVSQGQGDERTVTVLFADIRSFTTFSEKHQPKQVVRLLNEYFQATVPLIEHEGGTLNKYLGDGTLAIFSWPIPQPDHACRAVRAAVAMVKRVHAESALWARLGFPAMRIGIGIHTGTVVVGTVGSARRVEYTAIGDTVNAASRIEGENKALESEILISSTTFAGLPGELQQEWIGAAPPHSLHVKGKLEPMLVYALRT